jgi:V8-like Glu-specific endopeptidase
LIGQSRIRFGVIAALAPVACFEPELAERAQPIIGGAVDLGDPAVVGIRMCVTGGGCGICTGTLVSEESVLTASHCLDRNVEAGEPEGVRVFVGTNMSGEGEFVEADELALHRYFDPSTLNYDIAMIHLSEPAPGGIPPVTPSDQALGEEDAGMDIRLVGFGETSLDAGDSGTKRQVDSVVTSVGRRHLFVGTAEANTCKGDSGGPTFADFGAGEVQIGVTSRSFGCAANSVKMRVDQFTSQMIWPWIDRFEGPCTLDGECVADCPRSPDPDCDPCAWNGTCAADCAEPDWDCPLGKRLGEACGGDDECEFARCQAAVDDPRLRYCTEECDPEFPLDCQGGMECADPDGAGARCLWPGPTPGALGSTCGIGSDCRSGLCEAGVCVEPCDQVAGGVCPAPFECRSSDVAGGEVCGPVQANEGCGCGAAGRPGGWAAALLLLVLVSWRRSGGRRARTS